ncbi:hypothetical protein CHLNCDRAFT_136223 [Chlorella variabilis]|uniref:Uncharacterized protein n=1 Tax=Chlorella variabilis TaxID=554065 RepID=E1ZJ93_CHLVA|nr:hypothetical protein CHLNCDRAFT_136223 [Chlorella variabilis]EFN53955.1 hypothetical protein CHLNCDRAFT_136223 [Chlorella variabilis]|eukprot:XP_005846057.1 hypothetical protein CHLNCDRAFT_136223 [Chlorella variabilis]
MEDGGGAPSLSGVTRRRELGLASPRAAQRAMHFTESAARRLSVEALLRGHQGCVNRLAWNESGSLLASGSDDRKVMLWSYPDTQRQPVCVETEHQANIFGVRFLPQTGDSRLVTGAMDYTVQLHQLDTPPDSQPRPLRGASGMRRNPDTAATAASVRTVVYTCHRSRDVAVEPLNPHLFWSAAEDGFVRQYDTRLPTSQQRDFDSPNALLAVRAKGRFSELKSLGLNPARPHLLAVAAADPLLRVYDRRMLTAGAPEGRGAGGAPLLALAPPHLALCAAGAGGGRPSRMHATHLAFGNRGDKLVATYHGDHAYCFDVTGAASPASSPTREQQQQQQPFNLFAHPSAAAALAASRRAGGGGGGGHYEAVRQYSEAIRLAPWAPVLYTNRALALLQRGWEGDALCALQDAETAVCLDPAFAKAHYRRLQALRAAGMLQSATTAVRLFKQQFPEQAGDIALDVRRQAQQAELRRQQAEQRRQLRRRRGMQFDRRRQERSAAAEPAAATQGQGEGPDGPAAAADAAAAGAATAAAGAAGTAPSGQAQQGAAARPGIGSPGGGSAAAGEAAMDASVAPAGEAGTALALVVAPAPAAAAPAAPASAAAAGGDSWDDPYASGGSEDEEGEDFAAAAAGAAASSGIDAAYAAALEAAAAGGRGADAAAAARGAPSLDGLAAQQQQDQQQQQQEQGQEAGGRGAKHQAGHQPSLWSAFEGGRRMLQRYVGQCNLQTDIKEAAFLGADDSLVATGSDDGRVFIFAAATGECVRVMMADEDVANALWSPEGESTSGGDMAEVIRRNQERLKEGPTALRGVDPRIIAALTDNPELLRALMQRATRRGGGGGPLGSGGEGPQEGGEQEDEDEEEDVREVSCRVA